MTTTVIVCAHNEERFIAACLHSLLAQTRLPDEIIVINNASTDATGVVARQVPGVRVIDEPRKGLVIARERGRCEASGDLLIYLDADCRAPILWLERIARHFERKPYLLALSGNYRFYDWDWWGRTLIRAYDFTLGPGTQFLVKYLLGMGVVFYGGNFAVRRRALERIVALMCRSNFMAKTRIWAGGCLPSGRSNWATTVTSTPPPDATTRWGRARSSGSMSVISCPRSCITDRRIRFTSTCGTSQRYGDRCRLTGHAR